jgi:hypothetical protein
VTIAVQDAVVGTGDLLKCELVDTTTGTGNDLFFQFLSSGSGRLFQSKRLLKENKEGGKCEEL